MLETIPPIKRKKLSLSHEGNCKWKIGVMTSLFSSILTHPLRCHLVNWGCVGCQRKITQWPCSPEQWDFFSEAKKFNLAKPHWLCGYGTKIATSTSETIWIHIRCCHVVSSGFIWFHLVAFGMGRYG